MTTQPLTNIQLELLKLYATDLSEQELLELKQELARYFARKAIEAADTSWDEHHLTDSDMERWLDE